MTTRQTKTKVQMLEFKNYLGLDYITVHVRPDRISEEHGPVVSAERFRKIDQIIAARIISQPRPIRGKELKAIRKTLSLGVREFATAIGVTHPTVLNWEKARNRRLERADEVFIRIFFAEKLGITLKTSIETLSPQSPIQEPIEYTAA